LNKVPIETLNKDPKPNPKWNFQQCPIQGLQMEFQNEVPKLQNEVLRNVWLIHLVNVWSCKHLLQAMVMTSNKW
jgi:hypothetical protein